MIPRPTKPICISDLRMVAGRLAALRSPCHRERSETISIESVADRERGVAVLVAIRTQLALSEPAPGVATPGVATPGVATPGVATPGVATPGVATPGVATPGVATPGKFPGNSEFIGSGAGPRSFSICRSGG